MSNSIERGSYKGEAVYDVVVSKTMPNLTFADEEEDHDT